jgi:hypothetical protein
VVFIYYAVLAIISKAGIASMVESPAGLRMRRKSLAFFSLFHRTINEFPAGDKRVNSFYPRYTDFAFIYRFSDAINSINVFLRIKAVP